MILQLLLMVTFLAAFIVLVAPQTRPAVAAPYWKLRTHLTFGPTEGWTTRQTSPWPLLIAALLCTPVFSWAW